LIFISYINNSQQNINLAVETRHRCFAPQLLAILIPVASNLMQPVFLLATYSSYNSQITLI